MPSSRRYAWASRPGTPPWRRRRRRRRPRPMRARRGLPWCRGRPPGPGCGWRHGLGTWPRPSAPSETAAAAPVTAPTTAPATKVSSTSPVFSIRLLIAGFSGDPGPGRRLVPGRPRPARLAGSGRTTCRSRAGFVVPAFGLGLRRRCRLLARAGRRVPQRRGACPLADDDRDLADGLALDGAPAADERPAASASRFGMSDSVAGELFERWG